MAQHLKSTRMVTLCFLVAASGFWGCAEKASTSPSVDAANANNATGNDAASLEDSAASADTQAPTDTSPRPDTTPVASKVWTYNFPGGNAYRSPDYQVSVEAGGKTESAFVHYSFGQAQYQKYSGNGKLLSTHRVNQWGPYRHSAVIFSFQGRVTVRVKVNPNAKHISLPLKSAKVLPSSYNIDARIENGNTIVFTLDRPEKVVVIPNYDEVWNKFVQKGIGHVPIQSWTANYDAEAQKKTYRAQRLSADLTEGYSNPMIVIAHAPEKDAPKPNEPGTLIVKPGDTVTQNAISNHDVIWFKPGIHDLSGLGSFPFNWTMIKKGQRVYLEGGSYVMARFRRDKAGQGPAKVFGRGVVSGIKHAWVTGVRHFQDIDHIVGITLTDRAAQAFGYPKLIDDVALIGSWHGNTDGPDFLDDCLVQNSFLMSMDDNLKLNNNSLAKHLVIWQRHNASAIMVKEIRKNVTFANSVVEDVDIIAYFPDPNTYHATWPMLSRGVISSITGGDINVRNFTYKDIRIESPYIWRPISFYNLNTNLPWIPGWFKVKTSNATHTRIDGVKFSNIQVNSPVICFRSLLGSAYDNSFANVSFTNFYVQGTHVNEANKDQFFEIQYNMIENLTFR